MRRRSHSPIAAKAVIGLPFAKDYKTPKLLLEPLMPLYKINHATAHLLAWPVLVVGFAADRIFVSFLYITDRFPIKTKSPDRGRSGLLLMWSKPSATRRWS